MIQPGYITLELILNNPLLYIIWIYLVPLVIGGLSAYFADRAADEKMKTDVRAKYPQTDISKDQLDNIYEFEHIRDPIAWGVLAVIVVVLPLTKQLDAIGDWTAIWSASVLAGLTSRAILMTMASRFLTKTLKPN